MKSYINMGAAPRLETSAQVGQPDYDDMALRECQAYRRQLSRQFGEPPGSAVLCVRSFQHGFGVLHGVCIEFDTLMDDELEFAYRVEAAAPRRWNRQALVELGRRRQAGACQ